MGGKCTRDIKVIEAASRVNNSTSIKNNPNDLSTISHKSNHKKISEIKTTYNDVSVSNKKLLTDIKHSSHNLSQLSQGGTRRGSKKIKVLNENSKSTEHEVLKIIKKNNKELDDAKLIEACIAKHFFMRVLDRQARVEIVREMTLCHVQANATIFTQGAPGSFFYILKEGKVDVIVDEKLVKSLKSGENFGELALLHGSLRSATVKAVCDCYLWVLERKNFRKIIDHINQINFEENKKFIQSVPILTLLESDQKALICSNLIKEVFEEGSVIVKEGELASCIYIIKEGEVNCVSKGNVLRTLHKGDNFGERAVLVDSTRSLDVIAKTKCVCYAVSVDTLRSMMGEKFRSVLYLNFVKTSFATSKFFNKFNLKLLDKIFEHFQAVNLSCNQIAYSEGHSISSKFVVIIDGSLTNGKTNEILAKRGQILFEEELISENSSTTDYPIMANPDCLLIEVDTEIIEKLLGGSFKQIIGKSSIIETLMKVPLFRNLAHSKLQSLCDKIQLEKFESGSKIITEGEEGSKFYIVKKGKVDIVVNGNYIRTINEIEYFGERALFFKESRSASAMANGYAELFYLDKKDFLALIENNMKEYLMNRLFLQDNTVEIKDLDFIKELGAGNYGAVSLVQSKKNKFCYAIKGIPKKQIDHEQLHMNLELERSILLQIDHPFIVKLVKTLKDTKYIFFLMEYIKGKELFEVIRDIGLLNKFQTQFYGASIMLAVEYLHERKFIYRDIKPENIVVAYNGYIKLIDFGTAKAITDRTSTIIGTPHYMAPEVVLGEGYSFQVDYWSIAICMYEFVCGGVAFGETADDPMDVYMAIINEQLTFPSFVKDKEFKNLITLMLCKNPLTRMHKLPQIKNHIWFMDFSWENLISLNMEPAEIPKLTKEEEKKNLVSYITHFYNTAKEWQPTKGSFINPKKKLEYENWFRDF